MLIIQQLESKELALARLPKASLGRTLQTMEVYYVASYMQITHNTYCAGMSLFNLLGTCLRVPINSLRPAASTRSILQLYQCYCSTGFHKHRKNRQLQLQNKNLTDVFLSCCYEPRLEWWWWWNCSCLCLQPVYRSTAKMQQRDSVTN